MKSHFNWIIVIFLPLSIISFYGTCQENQYFLSKGFVSPDDQPATVAEQGNIDDLNFFYTGFDIGDIFLRDSSLFIASFKEKKILAFNIRSGELLLENSLNDFSAFDARAIYGASFYSDKKNVYWGRFTDFHTIRFDFQNGNWRPEIIVSFEKQLLPGEKAFAKILEYSNGLLLMQRIFGNSSTEPDKSLNSAVFFKRPGNEAELIYSFKTDQPVLYQSNIPGYPHVDLCFFGKNFFIWNSHYLVLQVYDSLLSLVREFDIGNTILQVKPVHLKTNKPFTHRVKILCDDKRNKLYFVVKNDNENEHLWWINLKIDLSPLSLESIKTVGFLDYEIRQVYDNKIYYTLKINGNSYICEQGMETW